MECEAKKRLLRRTVDDENRCKSEHDEIPLPSSQPPPTYSISADKTTSSMKPAWCQSEAANESAQEMAELNDEADLLDFVHDLDFDQYNQDLELKVLMGQVKDRIKKLQREKKKDENILQTCLDVSIVYLSLSLSFCYDCVDCLHITILNSNTLCLLPFQSENAADRAGKLDQEVMVDFVPSNMETNEEEDPGGDVKSITETVMSESTICSIHSRKSLTALVTRTRERIIGMLDPIDEGPTPQPNQSTITNDDGQRKKKKIDVHKLPFLKRNPAV